MRSEWLHHPLTALVAKGCPIALHNGGSFLLTRLVLDGHDCATLLELVIIVRGLLLPKAHTRERVQNVRAAFMRENTGSASC